VLLREDRVLTTQSNGNDGHGKRAWTRAEQWITRRKSAEMKRGGAF
jgi:hypothetical protein